MKSEIIEKLDKFLSKNPSLNEECQAVYLLVEVRKIMEHDNEYRYKLLRFFCDWTVHTKKDRNMEGIVNIVNKIDNLVSSVDRITSKQNEEILKFFKMNELRTELSQFLSNHSLPKALCSNNHWPIFIDTLAKVLSGQSIINPTRTIKSIEIVSDLKGSQVTIDFGGGRGSAVAGFGKYN